MRTLLAFLCCVASATAQQVDDNWSLVSTTSIAVAYAENWVTDPTGAVIDPQEELDNTNIADPSPDTSVSAGNAYSRSGGYGAADSSATQDHHVVSAVIDLEHVGQVDGPAGWEANGKGYGWTSSMKTYSADIAGSAAGQVYFDVDDFSKVPDEVHTIVLMGVVEDSWVKWVWDKATGKWTRTGYDAGKLGGQSLPPATEDNLEDLTDHTVLFWNQSVTAYAQVNIEAHAQINGIENTELGTFADKGLRFDVHTKLFKDLSFP